MPGLERGGNRRYDNNDAHQQAIGYESLGTEPDAFMGWMKLHNGYYSVRERSPFKETFPTDELTDEESFVEMAKVWAKVLATYHTRAIQNLRVDDQAYSIAKEVVGLTSPKKRARKDFKALVRDVAFDYANQVDTDCGYFRDAIKPDGC